MRVRTSDYYNQRRLLGRRRDTSHLWCSPRLLSKEVQGPHNRVPLLLPALTSPLFAQDEIEHQKKADHVVQTVLKLLDKDGDGKISPEEFTAAGYQGLPTFDDLEGHHYDVESGMSAHDNHTSFHVTHSYGDNRILSSPRGYARAFVIWYGIPRSPFVQRNTIPRQKRKRMQHIFIRKTSNTFRITVKSNAKSTNAKLDIKAFPSTKPSELTMNHPFAPPQKGTRSPWTPAMPRPRPNPRSPEASHLKGSILR